MLARCGANVEYAALDLVRAEIVESVPRATERRLREDAMAGNARLKLSVGECEASWTV